MVGYVANTRLQAFTHPSSNRSRRTGQLGYVVVVVVDRTQRVNTLPRLAYV